MNWYAYLPSSIAIYLILISRIAKGHLQKRVDSYVARRAKFAASKELILNIAADWTERLGFANSMLAAIVSIFSLSANVKDSTLIVLSVIILTVLFVTLLIWIFGLELGDLVVSRTRVFNRTPADICQIILIGVNVLLLLAIFYTQGQGPSTP